MRASSELWRLAAALMVVTAAGFGSKFYSGPGEDWLNDSLAGLFYVVFWCLAAALVWPRAPARRIAWVVLAATCALEVLQLWHPPWLQAVRATFPGAALLGTTFAASDFVYSAIGAGLGWLAVRYLRSAGARRRPAGARPCS